MEETNIKEVVEEIKSSDEETLRSTIEKWFESTQTAGMKLGAQFISSSIYGVIEENLTKKEKPSMRDYKRCIDGILKIILVQLTPPANSEETITEETANDE